MQIVIRKIRRGCLFPPIETKELDPIVEDWTEVLWPEVPIDQIQPAYLLAIKNPDRSPELQKKALKVTEVLEAYRRKAALESGFGTRLPKQCEFCKAHEYDPTEFPSCKIHTTVKTDDIICCAYCGRELGTINQVNKSATTFTDGRGNYFCGRGEYQTFVSNGRKPRSGR